MAPHTPGFLPGLAPTLASLRFPGHPSQRVSALPDPGLTSAELHADVQREEGCWRTHSFVRTADKRRPPSLGQHLRLRSGTVRRPERRGSTQYQFIRKRRLFALRPYPSRLRNFMLEREVLLRVLAAHYSIRLASTDGNPDTVEQADWTPLLVTPPLFPSTALACDRARGLRRQFWNSLLWQ